MHGCHTDGGSPGDPPPPPYPLFWVRKEEITEGRKPGRASKTKSPPTPHLKVWICP